jgi:hypothetical protein
LLLSVSPRSLLERRRRPYLQAWRAQGDDVFMPVGELTAACSTPLRATLLRLQFFTTCCTQVSTA